MISSTIHTHRRLALLIGMTLLMATGSVLLLEGCGSMNHSGMGMNRPSTASLAFVSNSGSGTVSAFMVSASGGLTPVSGSPFTSGSGAEFMAFDSVHNLLFVSNQGANSLSVFSVNTSSGMLMPAPGSPFPTGSGPTGVAVAPMLGLAFVGNQNDNSISVFTVNAMTGALIPVPGTPVTGISIPFGLTVNPAQSLLFVNSFGADAVSVFQINANGTLNKIVSSAPTSSPAGLTSPVGLATDGKQLFVANHMDESVVAFQINSGNGMISSASLPSPNPNSCGNSSCHNDPLRLTVDPMDKFVFATNVAAGTVSTFGINSGSLTPMSTAATGQHPFGVATDPTGSFLLVVNKADNTISVFSVNSGSGGLSPVAASPFAGGALNAPTDIVLVPSTASSQMMQMM